MRLLKSTFDFVVELTRTPFYQEQISLIIAIMPFTQFMNFA